MWSAQKTALKLELQKRSEQAGQILAVLRNFIWVGLLWRTLAFTREAESWQLEETGVWLDRIFNTVRGKAAGK